MIIKCLLVAAGLLLGTGLASPSAALAQTTPPDTTRLRYTEEVVAAPADPQPLPVPRAARYQWKLGLNNFLIDSYPLNYRQPGGYTYFNRYGVHLAYERLLGQAWSVQAEVSPALTFTRSYTERDVHAGFGLRAQVQGRYYYNQERRLHRSGRPSPFAANYLAVALGMGLGGNVRETPFYLLDNVPGFVSDAALLYGLQRRLGRYGFVDASLGISAQLRGSEVRNPDFVGSLRVGLALPAVGRAAARPVPPDEVAALLPRLYLGAQVGGYSYQVHYPGGASPFPANTETIHGNERWTTHYDDSGVYRDGYGSYTRYLTTLPYVYGGYYLTPRLAVQVGVQYESYTSRAGEVVITAPDGTFEVDNVLVRQRDWAVPVQVRYALLPMLQQRFQLDALGGITPLWSAVRLREYEVANRQLTSQVVSGFDRSTFGLHASAGLAAAVGFGRRRRVQAVLEGVLTKDLSHSFASSLSLEGGVSLGMRYRFAYR